MSRPPSSGIPLNGGSGYAAPTLSVAMSSGVVEQIGGDGRLGVGNPVLLGLTVGHRQQPPNTARDSIFRHHRVGESAKLLERCLPMLDAKLACGGQMVGDGVTEDLQRPLDTGSRR